MGKRAIEYFRSVPAPGARDRPDLRGQPAPTGATGATGPAGPAPTLSANQVYAGPTSGGPAHRGGAVLMGGGGPPRNVLCHHE